MPLKMLGDKVLVRMEERPLENGGIVLAESWQKPPEKGLVVDVGPGKEIRSGEFLPMSVAVGDRVLCPCMEGVIINQDGIMFKRFREEDLLGIIEGRDE